MSEPKSMCQPRLLGEATEEVIFPLSCRLLYYDFNRGSENPRQPVYDSSGGSNQRVHPVPPPLFLDPHLRARFNTHRSNLGAAV
jgi:hypothetical protein